MEKHLKGKIIFLVFISVFSLFYPAICQSTSPENAPKAESIKTQQAKIHFCRKNILRMGKANIYCNKIHIGKMTKGTALTLIVEPGLYTCQTDLEKDGVTLQVETAREYYIDISLNGIWGGYPIKLVDSSEEKPIIDKLSDKKKSEIHFVDLQELNKERHKSFFSEKFIKFVKYCAIVCMIISLLFSSLIVGAEESDGEVIYLVSITFFVLLAVAVAAYYPVLYIAKMGWKFLSILFQGHFWVGLLFFLDIFLNIWLGWLINKARDLSGAYETSNSGYWATQDGKRYMSAKKWETGEWTAPMRAVPKLILWNMFILFLSFLALPLLISIQVSDEIRFLIGYSSILFFIWLIYCAKRLVR